jgi:hypothetical protein
MLRLNGPKDVQFCDGLSRRDFLQVGTLGALGMTLTDVARAEGSSPSRREMSCIVLFLVGGPGQLDTWDLKPDAPDEIRGPFRPIPTHVPGIEICEHFPLMARLADKYAVVRSVYHKEAPIHETGHQLMQTGWLFRGGTEYPNCGSVVGKFKGPQNGLPPYVVVPRPIGNTGVSVPHGQDAGCLGDAYGPVVLNADPASPQFQVDDLVPSLATDPARMKDRFELLHAVDETQRQSDSQRSAVADPAYQRAIDSVFSAETKRAFDVTAEPDAQRDRYGRTTFGQSCLLARRLVERGVRMVTVNMFDTVFNQITWDCHANGGSLAVTLDDYRQTLCPMLDAAYSALIEDLYERGMLDTTLVLAMGEFGRTYKLNSRGGRDHWPNVWSMLFAGGGVRGGQVIGSSDKHGAEPRDRPVHASEVAATVYQTMGIDLAARLVGPHDRSLPLVATQPIRELFA